LPPSEETNKNKISSVMSQELLTARSSLYFPSQLAPYNPAQLYQKKGNYDLFDKMREDDQIRAVMDFKKSLVMGSGWYIDSPDEDIKKFWEVSLCQYFSNDDAITFDSALYEILTALDYGFSITEIIYGTEIISELDNIPKWILKNLKTRPPHSFEIYTDDAGNIEKIMQWQQKGGKVEVPKEKVLLYTYQGEFGNQYGRSEFNIGVYRSWWSKENLIKFWNIALERFGMPLMVGTYPTNSVSEDRDAFELALKNIQAKSSILMQDGFKLEERATVQGTIGDAFDKAIDKHNLMIARGILTPDLVGLSGAQNSSGGLGGSTAESQIKLFLEITRKINKELTSLINRRIIKPLNIVNFGNGAEAEIKFRDITKDKEYEAAKLFLDYMQKGGKSSDEQALWFMDIIGAPTSQMKEDQEEAAEKAAMMPTPPMLPGQQMPINGEAPAEGEVPADGEEPDGEVKAEGEQPESKDGEEMPMMKGKEPIDGQPKEDVKPDIAMDTKDTKQGKQVKEKKKKFTLSREPNKYEIKVNFVQIDDSLNNTNEKNVSILAETIKSIIQNLVKYIQDSKLIENKRIDKINQLQLRGTGELKNNILAMMKEGYALGKNSSDDKKEMALIDTDPSLDNADVAEWLKQASIYTTTEEGNRLLKIAKGTLMDAIRSGAGVKETIAMLDEQFNDWDENVGANRIETIVRTNTMKAFNQARANEFAKSDMIEAYEYSAIMDDRTSDLCAELDGKIFSPSEIDLYNPPNHYNCRSMLVPIYKDEVDDDFEYDDMPPTTREDGGFLALKEGA
jgi:SPP1 gp7 family putative phage head morphogenesis protein